MLKDPDVHLTAKLPSWNSAYILGLVSARLFKAIVCMKPRKHTFHTAEM